MALKNDKDGFLAGERLDGGDEGTDLLREIRDGVDGVNVAIGALGNRQPVRTES